MGLNGLLYCICFVCILGCKGKQEHEISGTGETYNKTELLVTDSFGISEMKKHKNKFIANNSDTINLYNPVLPNGLPEKHPVNPGRSSILDYMNKGIIIDDNYLGQSMMLVKENDEYLILRKFFGSGRPVVGYIKYKVVFNSDYQITFSEIVDASKTVYTGNKEKFILRVENERLNLYLNNLKIVLFYE